MSERLPCVVAESDDWLVVNKPAGVSTHAPSPVAADGIYEFLRGREPRWERLAIVHRLDKDTSGVMVFPKTTRASQSITAQFEAGEVKKLYLFETSRPAAFSAKQVKSALVRSGDRYLVRPPHAGAEIAVTLFRLSRETSRGTFLWEAEPRTGKTHQIRSHAASIGIPIRGDTLYGGEAAGRVFLHATEIAFADTSAVPARFRVEPQFEADAREAIRAGLIDSSVTNAYRWLHGEADGWPEFYVDRFGDYLLAQSEIAPTPAQLAWTEKAAARIGIRGVYHKTLARRVGTSASGQLSPRLVWGEPAPAEFPVRENGAVFLASFAEGYSPGLFLDQRENRRRWLRGIVGPGEPLESTEAGRGMEVLNAFAYTCGFSVCAAKAGARVTSVDLSRKYLDWGRRNFLANGLDPAAHDFIFGDVFEWLKRLQKKGRSFDAIVLDPPTFSRSRESGVFQAQRDYPRLLEAAFRSLRPGGVLLASSNAAEWAADDFAGSLRLGATKAGRMISWFRYAAQPLDFPISPAEPAYLKTAWLRLAR